MFCLYTSLRLGHGLCAKWALDIQKAFVFLSNNTSISHTAPITSSDYLSQQRKLLKLLCAQDVFGAKHKPVFLFSLQMFGCGAVAQLVLSGGSHGMFLTVNFAFGFAAMLGILVCGQISGTYN